MKYRILTTLLAVASIALSATSKDIKRPESYNYQRGVECIQQNDYAQAADYLNKELGENPKNGYALYYMAIIHNEQGDYGKALTSINDAIARIPAKDSEQASKAILYRGIIYENLDRDNDALADYEKAAKLYGEDVSPYRYSGALLIKHKRYDEAETTLRKILDIESGSSMAYALLSANDYARGNYSKAYDEANYAVKLEPSHTFAYLQRGRAAIKTGKWSEACDDAIEAIEQGTLDGLLLVDEIADSAFLPISVKLKVKALKKPDEAIWPYLLGECHLKRGNTAEAISCFTEAKQKGLDDIDSDLAKCYMLAGNYKKSIELLNNAFAADSTQTSLLDIISSCYDLEGDYANATAAINRHIKAEPDNASGYAQRATLYLYQNNSNAALDDCNTALALDADNEDALRLRMRIYANAGNTAASQADARKLLALDTVPDKPNINSAYALFYLGDKDKAIATAQKACADTTNFSDAYNQSCIYALCGRKQQALRLLQTSLQKGMNQFVHIRRDPDYGQLRDDADFKDLVAHYERKFQAQAANDTADDTASYSTEVVEVPYVKESGVMKVKCTVNGLPLHFVFDTGASDLSMSTVEATFMLKNGYLSANDLIGRQSYMNANGEITEGTVIRLRNVKFAGLSLDNVTASIVSSQQAPLLLGQSVLSKLGKVELDYTKKVIRVTRTVKKQ